MLSIGSRFRTEELPGGGGRQAEALAERNNWTLAELADRTIDTAGFDPAGVLDLELRRAGLHRTPAARPVDRAAQPGGQEDRQPARAAGDRRRRAGQVGKKDLSATKKQMKETVAQQTERLYEALCTERDWPFADWDVYLNHHPVARRLVQRLVWAVVDEGKAVQLFRPLEDGTLTDAEDEEVAVAPDARIRLAHDWLMKPKEVELWKQHLIDYEVKPLFAQLGKGTYELPKDRAGETEIKDFEGHLLEAFALRGRALKLGYTRGQAEDGGVFYTYVKRFPTLGIEAIIEFTGNGLPEENRTVALETLSFYASRANRDRPGSRSPRCPRSCSPSVTTTCARSPPTAAASTPSGGKRPASNRWPTPASSALPPSRPMPAELARLAEKDSLERPVGWRLSPRAVRAFIVGDPKLGISRKFYGDDALIDRCIVTLMSNRALLLVGEPGTAKSMLSELLAAAISGRSTTTIQGTAGTTEDQIKYSWNYALLLAEGPTPRALVPGPIYTAMEQGLLCRFEEVTRVQPEIQDSLISLLSDKLLHVPELKGDENTVFAARGFNVLATANIRDRGVHEMSSALKRRFNFETVRPIADRKLETKLVQEQTEALLAGGGGRGRLRARRRRSARRRLPGPAPGGDHRGRGGREAHRGDVVGRGGGRRLRRLPGRPLLRRAEGRRRARRPAAHRHRAQGQPRGRRRSCATTSTWWSSSGPSASPSGGACWMPGASSTADAAPRDGARDHHRRGTGAGRHACSPPS